METLSTAWALVSLRLRRRPDWSAAVLSGLAAGVVVAALCALRLRADMPDLLRRAAAFLLGPGVAGSSAGAEPAVVVAAFVVHAFLSAAFALPLADACYRLERRAALWLGAGYGLLLYFINLFAFTRVFPWFAAERGWGCAAVHVAYGFCAAYLYGRLERPLVSRSARA